MFQRVLSFEERADFLKRNICGFPEKLKAEAVASADGEAVIEGLRYFRELLAEIFDDTASYLVPDALDSYHNLTNTILFLYMAGTHGELGCEGGKWQLCIDKSMIRKYFKKPAAFYLDVLQNYGFFFEYMKDGHLVDTYKACTSVCMYNDNSSSLALALKYLCGKIPSVDSRKDYALQADLFAKADFSAILLESSMKRQDIDLLRADILRTLGAYSGLWEELVNALINEYGLTTNCSYWSYCTPQWGIHFKRKSKTVCIFSLHADAIYFEMSLPYEQAKDMAMQKNQFCEAIQQNMERFGCIKCGKCDGSGITTVDSIALCPHEAWARRLTFKVTSQEEVKAILDII